MADVEVITDGAAALDRCGDLFRADPVGASLVTTGLSPSEQSPVLRLHDGAETAGVVLVVADTWYLTGFTGFDRSVVAVAAEAIEANRDEEATLRLRGPAGFVADLAGVLSETSNGAVRDVRLSRLYSADAIVEPSKRRKGRDFVSDRDRLEQAASWGVGFGDDTGDPRSLDDARALMTRAVNEGRLIEWRSKDEVVAQLLISAARFGVVRIGDIYTPPEHRKRGHGAGFVAAVAQHQLDRQKVDAVVLTAPAENGSINRLYRRLGFGAVAEVLQTTIVQQ